MLQFVITLELTRYGLDGPGIESRWGRDFQHLSSVALQWSGCWMSFPGVRRSGRGVNRPAPSNAEIKERVELYLYSTSEPFVACSRANFTFTLLLKA